MLSSTLLNVVVDGWDLLQERQSRLAKTRVLPGYSVIVEWEPWFSYENHKEGVTKVSFTGTRYRVNAPNGATPIIVINS